MICGWNNVLLSTAGWHFVDNNESNTIRPGTVHVLEITLLVPQNVCCYNVTLLVGSQTATLIYGTSNTTCVK